MATSFWSATVLLILVTDPLGNIPLCLSTLEKVAPERRTWIVLRECMIAFLILLGFLFFGSHFLELLQLSGESLRVAGGVILFLIALKMIFPSGEHTQSALVRSEPFIVPLAVPLIAGPSAMATVLLLSTREPDRMLEWTGALTIAILLTTVVFLGSRKLQKLLGEEAITALERLMGLVLTAIAIEMVLSGLAAYLKRLA